MNTLTKLQQLNCQASAKLTSFGQLHLISDSHVNYRKSQIGLNAHKGPDKIKAIVVMKSIHFSLQMTK